MKSVVSEDTRKLAFGRAQLFSALMCLTPEIKLDRLEQVTLDAHALADEVSPPDAERLSTLEAHLPTPCLGVLQISGPTWNPVRHVRLLSGELCCLAALKLGASLPVYLLEDKGVEALIEAGLYSAETGIISDKSKAVSLLNSINLTIAAELLADTFDPIEQ